MKECSVLKPAAAVVATFAVLYGLFFGAHLAVVLFLGS
jgi:hypothetical protein